MSSTEPASARDPLLDRIEAALDEHVRTVLGLDGGEIVLVGIDADRIVQVRMTGACQSCPSSVTTLLFGVEAAVRAAVPEVRFVEAVP